MRNIYESRQYKKFILIPVLLMLVGLYFIPKIQLDSSLKGGINIQIQTTNTSIDIRQLTTLINQKIPGAQASISRSPSGLSIVIAANSTLASAETDLLGLYSSYANYSSDSYNVSRFQSALALQPGNATLRGYLNSSQASQQKDISQASALLGAELNGLKAFISVPSAYNTSNPSAMLTLGRNGYSNASKVYQGQVISKLQAIIPFTTFSYNEVTPTLGAFFLSQMFDIIATAFVLVAVTVFFVFRTPIPSFAVVFGAANDLIVALGAMGAFGIPLGVASIGGLLMLVGYSIDTDMLAAIRIIKRTEGTAPERAFATMKTGVTMTATAIISFAVLFVVSYLTFIPTYFQISSVVLIGLLGDLATTWLGDTTMVLWYKQRKQAVHQ